MRVNLEKENTIRDNWWRVSLLMLPPLVWVVTNTRTSTNSYNGGGGVVVGASGKMKYGAIPEF